MKDKLQTWSLIIGLSMLGPAFLGLAITCLFVGEIPGKRGPLVRADDSPIIFYIAAFAFIAATVKGTHYSWVVGRFLYARYKQQAVSRDDES